MKKNKIINKQTAKAIAAAFEMLDKIKEIHLIKKQTIEAENERFKLGGQFPSFEKSIENTGAIIIHNKIKKRKCLLSGLIKTERQFTKACKDLKDAMKKKYIYCLVVVARDNVLECFDTREKAEKAKGRSHCVEIKKMELL